MTKDQVIGEASKRVVELELSPLVMSLASLLPPLDQLEREIAGEDAPLD